MNKENIIPKEFQYSRKEVVLPQVVMNKAGVPVIVDDQILASCAGFVDLLGLLNGYKAVASVHISNVQVDRPVIFPISDEQEDDKDLPCVGRPVTDWEAWKRRLLNTCGHVEDIHYWRPSHETSEALVFRRSNIKYAALAHVCQDESLFNKLLLAIRHILKTANKHPPMQLINCISGRLFGYEAVDIEAWYFCRALSTYLLIDLNAESPESLTDRVSPEFRQHFHDSFLSLLHEADAVGIAVIKSDILARIISDIEAGMVRLGS